MRWRWRTLSTSPASRSTERCSLADAGEISTSRASSDVECPSGELAVRRSTCARDRPTNLSRRAEVGVTGSPRRVPRTGHSSTGGRVGSRGNHGIGRSVSTVGASTRPRPASDEAIGYSGTTTIRRSDFGVGLASLQGSKVVVGDSVTIDLDVEAFLEE